MSFFKCSAVCYGIWTMQAGFSVYQHHHNVQRTSSQSIRHLISTTAKRPNISSQHYLLSSPVADGRTSSPKTRKTTDDFVHAAPPEDRQCSLPGWPTSKAPWLQVLLIWRALGKGSISVLSRTQQHCSNLIQGWDEQHPRAAPSERKAAVGSYQRLSDILCVTKLTPA